jgi:lipoprotein-anchoring transpeptidase ErfK/SrfK
MSKTKLTRHNAWLLAGCVASIGMFAGLVPVAAEAHESVVGFQSDYPAGTIVISQHERKLYLTEGNGTAIRYPIAIGMSGRAWSGETYVDGKYMAPAWQAPAVVRAVHPNLKSVIPGGSPHNPMGAAAITLKLSEVAIHGTTSSMRRSVGTAASFGCIRMYNEDVLDLYNRVSVGTRVVSVP